jgi:tetratricopeptide (TPR) repeat protein
MLRKGGRTSRWDQVYTDYLTGQESGDVAAEAQALRQLIRLRPEAAWPYFDLALLHKWAREWPRALELNDTALRLSIDEPQNPAAWNLGIAATALGDWATARRAWTAFGIELPGGHGPILGSFGHTAIRLNPEPRHRGEQPVVVDGEVRQPEVVWADRLSPATAIVRSLPLPESGHRFGDVVLHDGEPVGERRLEGRPCPVFGEIALLERSPVPTWALTVAGARGEEWEALRDLAMARGGSAENWTTGISLLCRACSEGTVGGRHDHAPTEVPHEQQLAVAVPLEDLEWVVTTWLQGRSWVTVLEGPDQLL